MKRRRESVLLLLHSNKINNLRLSCSHLQVQLISDIDQLILFLIKVFNPPVHLLLLLLLLSDLSFYSFHLFSSLSLSSLYVTLCSLGKDTVCLCVMFPLAEAKGLKVISDIMNLLVRQTVLVDSQFMCLCKPGNGAALNGYLRA